MREFFKSIKFKILLAIVLVLGGFMVYQVSTGGATAITSSILSFVVTPIQSLSSQISSSISEFLSNMMSANQTAAKNEELQKQIDELKKQLVDYQEIQQENEQYKKALNIKEQNDDFEIVPALVTSRDPNASYESFLIDKGSLQGVAVQDPVITSAGLIGYVSEVGPTYSRVSTVLSTATNVGVINSRTKDTGTIQGTLELAQKGQCRLSYISRDSTMQVGDLLITSGTGGVYPQGQIVGTIAEIDLDPTGLSKYAVVTPVTDISSVQEVYIITSFLYQGVGLESENNQSSQQNQTQEGTTQDSSTTVSQ